MKRLFTLALLLILFFPNLPKSYASALLVDCSNGTQYTADYDWLVDAGVNPAATHRDFQTAIDAASSGEVIAVCPGTYTTGFNITRKNLVIQGLDTTSGSTTITDGGTQGIALILESNVELSNMSFIDGVSNEANRSAGISIGSSDVKLQNIEFTNNRASINSSAVEILSTNFYSNGPASLIVDQCLFKENRSDSDSGALAGSVYDYLAPLQISVTNTEFANNVGGAINMLGDEDGPYPARRDGMILEMDEVAFENNTSDGDGAGVNFQVGRIHMRNVNFTENQTTASGGAILVQAVEMTINNSSFTGNTAGGKAGAIFLLSNDAAPTFIYNSYFENNSAHGKGSMITMSNGGGQILGEVRFKNTTALNNSHENCFEVIGHSRNQGRNRFDDNSCF